MESIYFHVNKKPRFPTANMPDPHFMEVGKWIKIGEEDNQFIRRIKTFKGFEYLDENGSQEVYTIEQFKNEFISGEYKTHSNWPKKIEEVFGYYQWRIHELTLERVRVNEFQDKPSRFKCLWLCSSEDDAKMWKKECAGGHECNIVKVQAEGETFYVDASLLDIEDKPETELVDNMRLYWKGAQNQPGGKEEILFVGKIKVLEIL